MKQSARRHLINQFLQELDGVNSTNEGVLRRGLLEKEDHRKAIEHFKKVF